VVVMELRETPLAARAVIMTYHSEKGPIVRKVGSLFVKEVSNKEIPISFTFSYGG